MHLKKENGISFLYVDFSTPGVVCILSLQNNFLLRTNSIGKDVLAEVANLIGSEDLKFHLIRTCRE